MEISHYGYEELSELEVAVAEFNRQIADGEIATNRTVELYIEFFGPHDRLILANNKNGKIRGYMKYELNLPKGVETLDSMTSDVLGQLGFGDYEYGSVANVKYIESFPSRKGVGTAMMDSLKSLSGIRGIYLCPTPSSIGFYRKWEAGFEEATVITRTERFGAPYEEKYMVWKT